MLPNKNIYIKPKYIYLCFIVLSLFLLSHRIFDDKGIAYSFGKILSASSLIGIFPGFLVLQALRPLKFPNLLLTTLYSFIISVFICTILTITLLLSHGSIANIPIIPFLIFTVAISSWLFFCGPQFWFKISKYDLMAGSAILIVAGLAYVVGSPIFSDEEQVHASMVLRLLHLDSIRFDNFYIAPGITYTHPFPVLQVFMGLISKLGQLDPLFCFHKLRGFWTFLTLLTFYNISKLTFRKAKPQLFVFSMLVVGILCGHFADYSNLYWGQLVPYSHPSDVSLSLLLPLLILTAFSYIQSISEKSAKKFLPVLAMGAFSLSVIHLREVIQYLVYFFITLVLFYKLISQEQRKRIVIAIIFPIIFGAIYYKTHALIQDDISNLNQTQMNGWTERILNLKGLKIFSGEYISDTTIDFAMFPLLMLAVPAALTLVYRNLFIFFVLASVFIFTLIVRVPLVSYIYIRLTFFEILSSVLRNFALFLYFIPGILGIGISRIKVLKFQNSKSRPAFFWLFSGVLVGTAYLVYMSMEEQHFRNGHLSLILLFSIISLALILPIKHLNKYKEVIFKKASSKFFLDKPNLWIASCFILPILILNFKYQHSVLNIARQNTAIQGFPSTQEPVLTEMAMNDFFSCEVTPPMTSQIFALTAKPAYRCAPPLEFIKFAKRIIPVSEPVIASTYNIVPLSLFIPNQLTAFPLITLINLYEPDSIYKNYFKLIDMKNPRLKERDISLRSITFEEPIFGEKLSVETRIQQSLATQTRYWIIHPPLYQQAQQWVATSNGKLELLSHTENWAIIKVN